MKTLLAGGSVYTRSGYEKKDVLVEDGMVLDIGDDIKINAEKVIHCDNFFLIPGLIDVHVHFREPGAEYKETIMTGSASAAAGGYSTVLTMPNLSPAPYDLEGLRPQLDAIENAMEKGARAKVIPYGRITDGKHVADLEELAPFVCAFSDDGAGVQDEGLMREAMIRAKALGKLIVAHSEDTLYAPEDPRSEYKQIERDIKLADETGCSHHVCHVSSKESISLIRDAKKSGVDITCETAPHYLVFSNEALPDDGRFKMNPPIRSKEDKEALLEAVSDGTVDMIATDHAPHSAEEKSRGFKDSLNGILGLESAFPVMYTRLVLGGVIDDDRLIELMSGAPARRFGLAGGAIEKGGAADIAVVDLDGAFRIDPSGWKSKGRSTPFEGMEVKGRIMMTMAEGKMAYER